MSQLRRDKVALRLEQAVRAALEEAVPDGRSVLFSVTAPIREPSKTAATLVGIMRLLLAQEGVPTECGRTLHGNEVRARVVERRLQHGKKVVGFVHNASAPSDVFLDVAEAILVAAEVKDTKPSAAAEVKTWRLVCRQVLDAQGCAEAVA